MCAYRPRQESARGCDPCRRRKVKCDETHPTCSACARLKFPCTWVGGPPTRPSVQRYEFELITQATIQPSLTDIACHQFLRGYKFLSGNTSSIDPLYELIEPMQNDAADDPSSSSLVKAFKAISLAYMGTQSGEEEVLSKAQEEYAKTITILRRTVHLDQDADISRVLMTVRLCTGFEKTGWAFHMKAQATLARKLLRRLHDENWVDHALFFATFVSIAVVHGYARAPLPFAVDEVTASIGNKQDLQLQLVVLTMRVNDIRRQADHLVVQDFSPERQERADKLAATATRLSKDLQKWEAEMQAFSPVEDLQLGPCETSATQSLPCSREIWCPVANVYKCLRHANLYNLQRCGLIYTHAAVAQVRCWSQVEASSTPDLSLGDCDFETMQAAIDKICGSTPYYLGLYDEYENLGADTRQETVKFGGGHSSLWFWLATAVGVETVDPTQRDWIMGRLQFIGDDLGHGWAKFICKNPPSDVILGSRIDAATRDLYRNIPGWPREIPQSESPS